MLVKGASAMARSLGISNLAVGMTVVAFGTSAPELAVNIGAALRDTGGLAFGNIFGSTMANIGLVVGLVAIIQPIPIKSVLIRRELPMMLLALTAAGVMAFDVQLGGTKNAFLRPDGLILLLFFVVFLYYSAGDLRRQRALSKVPVADTTLSGKDLLELAQEETEESGSLLRNSLLTGFGLIALVGGAELTVCVSSTMLGLNSTLDACSVTWMRKSACEQKKCEESSCEENARRRRERERVKTG